MFTLIMMTKSGKIKDKQLTCGSSAMLKLWVLQNVSSGYAVILNEQNEIVSVWVGGSFPKEISQKDFPFNIAVNKAVNE